MVKNDDQEEQETGRRKTKVGLTEARLNSDLKTKVNKWDTIFAENGRYVVCPLRDHLFI